MPFVRLCSHTSKCKHVQDGCECSGLAGLCGWEGPVSPVFLTDLLLACGCRSYKERFKVTGSGKIRYMRPGHVHKRWEWQWQPCDADFKKEQPFSALTPYYFLLHRRPKLGMP